MFTTFLAGSPFPQPPRPGRQRQKRRRRSKRDTTSDRRSPSTSSGGGQKGNIRTGSSSGGAPPANNWFYEQWGTFSGSMSKAVGDLQSKTKKFEVPVKVDVDWVKPTLTSMKDMASETWDNLPPEVRRICPYVARYKNDELQTQIVTLLKDNKELETKIKTMQEDTYSSPRIANEMKMANAVAQATMAAAQAAEAAAAAAQACGLRVRRAVSNQRSSASPNTSAG